MEDEITTIDDLAGLIRRTMASKEDVQASGKKAQSLDKKVTAGFESIETLLMEERKRKIEDVEKRMRTCSTEAEIRRHCAYKAPKEINSGGYRRLSLAVSTIRHT
jgi:hypothetical protein